jgi:hypothetical protein
MSDNEEDWDSDDPRRVKKEDPLPEYTVRFTDMSDHMVKKAVRCKYNSIPLILQIQISIFQIFNS